MTGTKRRRRLLWLLAPLSAALVLVAPAAGTGKYGDPTGDAGAAPDITGLTVSSDANGTVVFRVNVASWPTQGDVELLLGIDTDSNPETGSASWDGAEYGFDLTQADRSYELDHWNGTTWDYVDSKTTRVLSDSHGVTLIVNRSELGGAGEFNFWAETQAPGDAYDDAPDDGAWNYALTAGGPNVRQVLVQTVPSTGPRAGRAFTVKPTGLQLPPSGATVQTLPVPESYTCRARLAGKVLAGRDTAGCTFAIPKKARGKQLVVDVTVSYQGVSKTTRLSFRVR
jgi:hypothetical protein